MTPLPVARITVDSLLGLIVVPQLVPGAQYEYIYRAGNGLRWNTQQMGFCAYEPKRWQAGELLRHIATTVAAEFGEELQLTPDTSWEGVSPSLRAELTQAACSVASSAGQTASHSGTRGDAA